ncbi:hypothetical protein NIES2111_28180 [Nostoc sp. NIES-2111]|nr:hypothetical protein NIES2111_28180 [Nostoc sp. NIES-2111]
MGYKIIVVPKLALTHILHLEIEMSKPQLRARGIMCTILSKKEDTIILGKMNSKAVFAACPQSGKS